MLEGRNLLSGTGGAWNFVSMTKLHPAKVDLLARKAGASTDPIFVAPYAGTGGGSTQTGPLMVDSDGNPIWYDPVSTNSREQVVGFQAQTLNGKPVLTWWQGTLLTTASKKGAAGTALSGEFVIANQNYQIIKTIRAPQGFSSDLHELKITPQGDAYFITNHTVKADLTAYGGPKKGSYIDQQVREMDLRTGKIISTWDMAAHVPLSDSVVPIPTAPGLAWDAYHLNSIDVSADGSQVLLSARNTWGIYDVNQASGQLNWQLGGKENQFALPSDLVTGPFGSAFQYQHDARFVNGGISLFDDAGAGAPPYGGPYGESRGLILNLDVASHVASLASPADVHDPALLANSQGNMQDLPNGDTLVGWGLDALPNKVVGSYISEFSGDGTELSDYLLGDQEISYRAFTQPWVGIPLTKPAVAASSANGQTTVYASWNGSTEVKSWELLAGSSRNSLSEVSVTTRDGFETAISTASAGPFFEVRALDAAGNVLKTSAVIRLRR